MGIFINVLMSNSIRKNNSHKILPDTEYIRLYRIRENSFARFQPETINKLKSVAICRTIEEASNIFNKRYNDIVGADINPFTVLDIEQLTKNKD